MSRIAVVGSCITRDLWPIRGDHAERLLYVSRTSFPSLLSAPVRGFTPADDPPADLGQHEHRSLVADIRKTALDALVAFRPTHLILDLIDERFDLLSMGASLTANSGEMIRSGYETQTAFRSLRTIPRLSEACERIWREGAEEFAALLRGTPLGRARLILHSARWAERQRLPDGTVAPIERVEVIGGHPVQIPDYNALLVRQEAVLDAVMPPMERVEAPALRLADHEHRWGLSPFHYIPEYYDEIRRQLEALGLDGEFSGPRVAPSVPVV